MLISKHWQLRRCWIHTDAVTTCFGGLKGSERILQVLSRSSQAWGTALRRKCFSLDLKSFGWDQCYNVVGVKSLFVLKQGWVLGVISTSWKEAMILHMWYPSLFGATLEAAWLPGTAVLSDLLLSICSEQKGHHSNEGQGTNWRF